MGEFETDISDTDPAIVRAAAVDAFHSQMCPAYFYTCCLLSVVRVRMHLQNEMCVCVCMCAITSYTSNAANITDRHVLHLMTLGWMQHKRCLLFVPFAPCSLMTYFAALKKAPFPIVFTAHSLQHIRQQPY